MKKQHLFLSIACALAVGSIAVGFGPARADADDPREVRYTISRNGDRIGTHAVRFRRSGDRMTVEHQLRVRVTVLSLEAYRYDLRAQETWSDDRRLLGFHSTTDRNGEALQVFARAGGSGIRIRRGNGERSSAPREAIPADPHWNVLSPGRAHMIEAEDGSVQQVRVSEPRAETLSIGGRRVETRRYEITGDHVATLWYDAGGYLVKKRLRASDGSVVITEMR